MDGLSLCSSTRQSVHKSTRKPCSRSIRARVVQLREPETSGPYKIHRFALGEFCALEIASSLGTDGFHRHGAICDATDHRSTVLVDRSEFGLLGFPCSDW